jgi:hypothetical protein
MKERYSSSICEESIPFFSDELTDFSFVYDEVFIDVYTSVTGSLTVNEDRTPVTVIGLGPMG